MSWALTGEHVTAYRPATTTSASAPRGPRGQRLRPGVPPNNFDKNRATTVDRRVQASCFCVPGALTEGRRCFPTLKPQPTGRPRPQLQEESADPKGQTPVHVGKGPAAAAAEYCGGIPGVARGPTVLGGAGPLSPHSPEVDLIPASFAGAQQHRRGQYGRAPAAYRPLFKKNRSCNHPGTNQSVSSFRV